MNVSKSVDDLIASYETNTTILSDGADIRYVLRVSRCSGLPYMSNVAKLDATPVGEIVIAFKPLPYEGKTETPLILTYGTVTLESLLTPSACIMYFIALFSPK
jgi:hypothetical protein